jgi:hypothetical protein
LCDEPPPDVRDLNPQIPDWLADIIDRLHAKRPRDRFRNAAELARLLNRHLAHLRSPETVEKPGALPAPRKFGWRLAASIIAAGLVLCSLAVGILIWSVQSPSATTNQQAESREPPKPAPPEKVDVYFQKLRADLDDPNVHTCREALARLATMKPNSQRADVAKRLVALTEVEDTHIRRPAIVTLGVWGSENEVPALMKAMEHPDVFTRREALKVIGRFRDRRSLPVVIRCLRDFFTRADAEKAMCELGPMAEADVLVILNETDVGLKKSAIQVLADIGTEASVPALTEIANHGKVFFMEPARQALNAIAARKKQ